MAILNLSRKWQSLTLIELLLNILISTELLTSILKIFHWKIQYGRYFCTFINVKFKYIWQGWFIDGITLSFVKTWLCWGGILVLELNPFYLPKCNLFISRSLMVFIRTQLRLHQNNASNLRGLTSIIQHLYLSYIFIYWVNLICFIYTY